MSWQPKSQSTGNNNNNINDNRPWRRQQQHYEQSNNYRTNYDNNRRRHNQHQNRGQNHHYHNNNQRHRNYNNNYRRNNNYSNNRHNDQYQRYYNRRDTHGYYQRYHGANDKQHPMINNQSKDIKYVKNTGKFQIEDIPFGQLTETLQTIWDKYYNKNVDIIEKMIFLCGPPGSGKTSIGQYTMKYYKLNELQNDNDEYLIDVSQMASDVMKENNRKLIIAKVYEKLFKQILQNEHKNKILIIDGFLRKEQDVYVCKFLQSYMKNAKFIFLVISVDEDTSVKRQLERGKKLVALSHNDDGTEEKEKEKEKKKEHKPIRLKDSDLNEDAARRRYQKYNHLLDMVRYRLKNEMKVQGDIIDGTMTLNEVFEMVQKQLIKQDVQ